jgi:RNA polymerase sigma factor (sigma-70 family)
VSRQQRGFSPTQVVYARIGGGGAALDFGELLSEIYVSERRCLLGVAAKAGATRDDAADAVQEAFVEALEHREDFAGTATASHLRCWLRTVVYHHAVDAERRRHCHPMESLNAKGTEWIDEAERDRSAAEMHEWLAAVFEQGRGGNEEIHRLLCEHYLLERSIKELAAEAGLSEKAVECRLARHRKQLRDAAEDNASAPARRRRKGGLRKKPKK